MNICKSCTYSTSVKCNMKRHTLLKHNICENITPKQPTQKICKPKRQSVSKYEILFNLINELKNEVITLKNTLSTLMTSQTLVPDVIIPVVQVYQSIKLKDLKIQLAKTKPVIVHPAEITSEYLTETFASAPNIETVIAQIGVCNRDLFEPIDKIEDDEELIATLRLSYKGTQLIFDNGDPFSWTTAYFIDDIDDFLEKCKQGKELFYLKLFTKVIAHQSHKCFYYDKTDDMYWVKSKNKWNTFWTSEARALRFDIVDAINKYGYNIIRYSKCGLIETSKDDVSNLMTELKKDVDCKLFENAIFSFFKSS